MNKKGILKSKVELRDYQKHVVDNVLKKGNSLIVIPTGLGKTIIGLDLIARVLEKKGGKALFLAPTKPLIQQHFESCKDLMNLEEYELILLSGNVKQTQRKKLFEDAKVIIATPQTIGNEVKKGRLDLQDVSIVIFDESHKAVKDYAYVFLAENLRGKALVVGLTASPGSTKEKIDEICDNLGIENIELKSYDDEDVKPYVNEIVLEGIRVDLPDEIIEVTDLIKEFVKELLESLQKYHLVGSASLANANRMKLLEIQRRVSSGIRRGNKFYYVAARVVSALLKLRHALILLETQNVKAFNQFMDSLEEKAVGNRTDKMIVDNPLIREAKIKTRGLIKKGIENPKVELLAELLSDEFDRNKDARVIVFNHFRDSVHFLEKFLIEKGFKAKAFVGQSVKKGIGLKQKEQEAIINEFRSGTYNVLISTSVAEEGLDIPKCDLIIMFEPVPTEIRKIQRVGRTGRFKEGKALILIVRNTSDESSYYASLRKEKVMKETLREMKNKKQKNLKEFM